MGLARGPGWRPVGGRLPSVRRRLREGAASCSGSIDCAGILKLRNSDIELRKGETDIGRKNTRVRLVFRVHIPQPNGRTLSLQVASNPIECCKYCTSPSSGGAGTGLGADTFFRDAFSVLLVWVPGELCFSCAAAGNSCSSKGTIACLSRVNRGRLDLSWRWVWLALRCCRACPQLPTLTGRIKRKEG